MTHLDREILLKFLRDELDPDSNASTAEHIETCLACESLLESLAESGDATPTVDGAYSNQKSNNTSDAHPYEQRGGSLMHKPISPSHGSSRFSWRTFFFGVFAVFIPMLVLVPLAGVAWLLAITQERQVATTMRHQEQRAMTAERAAMDSRIIMDREAAPLRDTMGSEMALDSGAFDAPAVIAVAPTHNSTSRSSSTMGAASMRETLPRNTAGTGFGASFSEAESPAAKSLNDRMLQVLTELVQQQKRQQEYFERQAQFNAELLHLLRASSREQQTRRELPGAEATPESGEDLLLPTEEPDRAESPRDLPADSPPGSDGARTGPQGSSTLGRANESLEPGLPSEGKADIIEPEQVPTAKGENGSSNEPSPR